jgi:lipopolysaccharide biosynthesis glycosyltransferase
MTIPTQRPILHIVSNADERFFPGLAVAVASAVASASGKCDYHILILDGGLAPGALDRLAETIAGIADKKNIHATLDPLVIDQSRLLALPERRGSRMTYAKLVLPEILPQLDSIIYLDADVLCFTGLEKVRPPAGEENRWLLAGARDFHAVIEKDCPWLDQVPPDERQLPYINCGVMWMNLKGLRHMDFTTHATALTAMGDTRYGDQTIFNFLSRGNSMILSDLLNHRTAIGASRELCEGNLDLNLHFIGSPKPWLGPPKTSNWLAHQLWHQAATAIFPERETEPQPGPPHDMAIVRRKSWLYAVTNPKRAANYGWDLRSLNDPAGALGLAKCYWDRHLVS